MMMHDTGQCGVQEICGLSFYGKDAERAMLEFCKLNIAAENTHHRYGSCYYAGYRLFCFYLFTAASEEQGYAKYGTAFADYIKEHQLGDVVGTPKTVNRAFHPDHSNQAWLWTPDEDALRAWWDEHKPPIPPSTGAKVKGFAVPAGPAEGGK